MEYIELGRTSLTVSRIALGTVELGMDYGFRSSPHYRKPEEADAIRTIHKAIDLGINLIDTARGYGSSEEIIGRALKESGSSRAPILASKVVVPEISSPNGHHHALHAAITQSIDESLRALRVDTLDLLQIHNTSLEILNNEEAIRAVQVSLYRWRPSRTRGSQRFRCRSISSTAACSPMCSHRPRFKAPEFSSGRRFFAEY